MSIKRWLLMALLMTGAVAVGCGDDGSGVEAETIEGGISDPGDGDGDGDGDAGSDGGGGDPIEIAGTWYNVTLDLVETFSSTSLTGDFVPVEIVEYDNELNTLILRFEDENDPSKYLYTKVVWLEPDASGFYYCPVAFELTSVEEARAAEDISDSSDPSSGGCDGEPWTRDVPLDQMPDD